MSENKRALAVGDALPALSLPDVNGGTIRLLDYRGRRLFIFMWASW